MSGYAGSIKKWQYCEYEDTTWVDLMDTSQVLNPGILTSSRMYRAVVKNGVCQEIISDTALVTISEPVVTFVTALLPVCVNEPAITLQGGSPQGGTYSGPGVSGNTFLPVEAGAGYHEIIYTWADSYGCQSKDLRRYKS